MMMKKKKQWQHGLSHCACQSIFPLPPSECWCAVLFSSVYSAVCSSLFRTVDLEAFCHEHLDEHFKTLKVEIPALWNDAEQPDKRGALRTLLCGGLTGSCKEERQKYKEDQKKKKEEIKRKKNEAQKERRRQREAQKSGSDQPKEEL